VDIELGIYKVKKIKNMTFLTSWFIYASDRNY